MNGMTWKEDVQGVFEMAIRNGVLSLDNEQPNYAGHMMYMGTNNGRDLFKHQFTRQYVAQDVTA